LIFGKIMDYKKQVGKKIAALLLFIALILPTAIQFFHMFEVHEHVVCTEQKVHLHRSIVKCDICQFNLASFNYDIVEYPDVLLTRIPENVEITFVSFPLNSFKNTTTQLRAPPIYS